MQRECSTFRKPAWPAGRTNESGWPTAATAEGYALSGGCVTGPERGAMGVHFVNASLVGDGALDATRPEALVYEPREGRLELVAVEYLVIAE